MHPPDSKVRLGAAYKDKLLCQQRIHPRLFFNTLLELKIIKYQIVDRKYRIPLYITVPQVSI